MSDTHAQTVAFVRETEIPQSPPPALEAGAVKWVRENLFSGIFNTVLTLLALYVVVRFAIFVFPWFYNGVWEASSRKECLDILREAGKGTGACFAVLVDRWDHLVFGFKYPHDGYWQWLPDLRCSARCRAECCCLLLSTRF